MDWKNKALELLRGSLIPVPAELNELDWKSGLSPKTERLAQHICAFANQKGGGLFVFGVNNDGTLVSVTKQKADDIIQKLGNIAKNNLAFSIQIEHAILTYESASLLFVYIPEQVEKPVHLRGSDLFNSYCRSAGQTTKMSRSQVKSLIALSQDIKFEDKSAKSNLTHIELLKALDYKKLYALLDRKVPADESLIMELLTSYKLCREEKDGWVITNLGAILFATDISLFTGISNRTVIVRKYVGANNRDLLSEQVGRYGYAVGFEGLVDYIMKLTSTESIETIREQIPTYPRVAIRELVANALVHQDFSIEGTPIIVEIFSNRLLITNPGSPLNDINRLIDLPPNSRNELLAQMMFQLGICERRGSGMDRAVEAIEKMHLPAIKITKSEQHTRVFLFPKKSISEMTREEKIAACYQHACIVYEDNNTINNQSIRERFKIEKTKTSVASRIIADTLEAGHIKLSDSDIKSKKYATYIPYYG